jgi:hypothetical protein
MLPHPLLSVHYQESPCYPLSSPFNGLKDIQVSSELASDLKLSKAFLSSKMLVTICIEVNLDILALIPCSLRGVLEHPPEYATVNNIPSRKKDFIGGAPV